MNPIDQVIEMRSKKHMTLDVLLTERGQALIAKKTFTWSGNNAIDLENFVVVDAQRILDDPALLTINAGSVHKEYRLNQSNMFEKGQVPHYQVLIVYGKIKDPAINT